MFLSRRGLGRQEYHSLIGATQVFGMPLVTGLPVSSTISLAGSGGQLLTPKAAPPMNCLNHVHRELRSLNAETWKPSHAPPFSMYRSKAGCCAPGGGLLSQTISLYDASSFRRSGPPSCWSPLLEIRACPLLRQRTGSSGSSATDSSG